jgi:tetratricopeptide (TPR) repeat protein
MAASLDSLSPNFSALRRRAILANFLCVSLSVAGGGLSSKARAASQDPVKAPAEYWSGTITIQAHAGEACAETSASQSLPYRKLMMLELRGLPSGLSEGFAWGDMVPTRLGALELSAASKAGGSADVVITGPSNFLRLTWLPVGGLQSPGELSPSAGFIFKRKGDVLNGVWNERMVATKQTTDQCLWSEASVLLERMSPAKSIEMAQESQALQQVFALIERQNGLPAQERWSPEGVAQLLHVQQPIKPRGYGARTLIPVMTKLTEQLVLNQSASKAVPVLSQIMILLEGLLDQGPLEYAAYVSHLTPMLRMAGMLDAAQRINRQSISALVAQGHGKSPELAQLLSGYGALLLRLQDYTQALQVYEQALTIERGVKEGKHIGVVIALVNLSRACETLGRQERAKQLVHEASDLNESLGLGPLKLDSSNRGYASQI